MSVYAERAGSGKLPASGSVSDTLFIDQRFEREQLEGVTFEQCTFANVSFKETTIKDCRFFACVFERCYFRRSTLENCRFPASRFLSCEFIRPALRDCEFGHTRFERCYPPYEELRAHLPGEDNLRATLTANLANEAESLGDRREARAYRLESLRAGQRDLGAAARGATSWYREHYDTLGRINAAWQLALNWVNGALWGYGERAHRLLVNLFVAAAVIWPILYLLTGDHVRAGGQRAGYPDALALSVGSLLNSPGASGVSYDGVARVLVLAETAVGFVVLGLFVTYLLRWITRR